MTSCTSSNERHNRIGAGRKSGNEQRLKGWKCIAWLSNNKGQRKYKYMKSEQEG